MTHLTSLQYEQKRLKYFVSLFDGPRSDLYFLEIGAGINSEQTENLLIEDKLTSDFYSGLEDIFWTESLIKLNPLPLAYVGSIRQRERAKINKKLKYLSHIIRLIISLQYIAKEIHNRLSESPSLLKKEPPIGGLKVGGKQQSFGHAA